MQRKLDAKIASLRSQSMNFTNNGNDFVLNVPDTDDVKNALRAFVSVMADQQNQIEDLKNAMNIMETQHSKTIHTLIDWTTMIEKYNKILASKLNKAHEQIKNFSHNVQGFTAEDDAEVLPILTPIDLGRQLSMAGSTFR